MLEFYNKFINKKHTPHINGLRGLSVLAVIFYHLDVIVPSGFYGVDVFFVISGYIITKLIVESII